VLFLLGFFNIDKTLNILQKIWAWGKSILKGYLVNIKNEQ
jgi:hypothetical protein